MKSGATLTPVTGGSFKQIKMAPANNTTRPQMIAFRKEKKRCVAPGRQRESRDKESLRRVAFSPTFLPALSLVPSDVPTNLASFPVTILSILPQGKRNSQLFLRVRRSFLERLALHRWEVLGRPFFGVLRAIPGAFDLLGENSIVPRPSERDPPDSFALVLA
jgi:hypothetical protein